MKVKRFLSVIIMISTMVSILMMSFPAKAMETVAVQNDSDSYKSNSDYDPCANGHNYKLTGWIWNGYESAYATFVCENKISGENFGSAHSKTITAQITSSVSTGSNGIIYTATVVCDGKTYTDTKIIQYGENGSKIIGDVDNDGRITSADALLVLRNSVGLEFFSDKIKKLADIDKDGKITSADSLDILRYSVGLSGNNDIGKKLEEEAQEDKTILYPDGDKVYVQSLDHLSYDEENSAIFFNNLLNVFTYDDLSGKKANILAESVGGEVVGDISGAVNLLQIKIPTSDYSNIQLCVEKLLANDTVMYASYDVPMFMEPSAETNPWTVNSEPGAAVNTNNNTASPDGNNWWAEAINAYTAWEYEDCFKPVNVGILDSGCMFDHEDLKGADLRLLEGYETNSPDEHGTHVTGIICAQDNSIGIRGIADRATVYSADYTPFTDDDHDPNYVNLINTGGYIAITKRLIESGVKVINNSWGRPIMTKSAFKFNSLYNLLKGNYDEYCKSHEKLIQIDAANCICLVASLLNNNKRNFIIVKSAGNGYSKRTDLDSNNGLDCKYSSYYNAINEDIFNRVAHPTIFSLKSEVPFAKLEGISYHDIDQRIITVGAVKNKRDENGNYYIRQATSLTQAEQ